MQIVNSKYVILDWRELHSMTHPLLYFGRYEHKLIDIYC